jgi:hypothetical protein
MSNIEMLVIPHAPVTVSNDVYPWINSDHEQVPTVSVTLVDGTTFIYGSLVGLNHSIRKIADSVAASDSNSTQTALFMGLPSVLQGRPHPGISKVENSHLERSTLLVASRNLTREPSLIFAVDPSAAEDGTPTVLRAGIGTANEYPKILGIMGIRQAGGKRRKA